MADQTEVESLLAQLRAAEGERDEAVREHGKEGGFWGRAAARALDRKKAAEEARERAERALKEALASPGNLFVCRQCNVLVPRAEMEQHEHDREALRARATAAEGALREARKENTRLRAEWKALDCDCETPGGVKCRDAIREGFQRPLREENTPLRERWKLAEAPIAFVRTFARALLGDEDGGVHDWMRESGDGSLLVEWHAALASLARLDAASDNAPFRQPPPETP